MVSERERADARDSLERLELWPTVTKSFLEFLALPPTARTLVLGCGPGPRLLPVATSEEPSRARDAQAFPAPQNHFSGPGADVPPQFSEQSLDAVLTLSGLWEVVDPVEWLQQVHRRLTPGGMVALMVPSARCTVARLNACRPYLGINDDEYARLLAIVEGFSGPDGQKLFSEHRLEQLLPCAGWRRLRTLELMEGLFLAVKAWR